MRAFRQLFIGLVSAIGTSLIVLTAGALAIIEGQVSVLPQPEQTAEAPAITSTLVPGQPTFTPSPTSVQFIHCNVPHGWQPYKVKLGDTLETIAEDTGLSAEQISEKNCLFSRSLPPGTTLYLPASGPTATSVPPLPTVTLGPTLPVATQCGPPAFWVTYIVRPGDTLYRLSLVLGVSQEALIYANCLNNSYLYAGQRIYVPFIPAPLPTRTSIPTATGIPLPSATPVTPSATPVTPVVETTEPAVETTEPAVETTEPVVETTEPVVETTEPAAEITAYPAPGGYEVDRTVTPFETPYP